MPSWFTQWQAIAIGAVFLAILSFGAGWTICGWNRDSDQLDTLKASVEKQHAVAVGINNIAGQNAKAEQDEQERGSNAKTIIQRDIIEKPVYRDCLLPAISVRAINGLITGADPSQP